MDIDLSTIEPEELNRRGEKLGEQLNKDGIKTNQIRNLYSTIHRIRVRASPPNSDINIEDINRRLIFLKPKLAYASGRQSELEPLRKLLVSAIDSVVKNTDREKHEKARENFFILMESIVAYHKFYGGEE